ncbi:diguanylate cyclase [Acidisoma cellulosilytica]|uniref:diguanylate cyclase n=1 Tax=Acidisoma cellulosilyticum TaxID=2802395 RepID=A0A963Z187_9PROT|nr:diguanylate cyclase [Acidisoma cellulosilyticum]MCB8880659.1 diguanylate cyclase [Acidisoma cellulosilyticum]
MSIRPIGSIERRLTISYVLALTLVALLTIISHFVLMRVLATQNGFATVISISERQPMLSQRIASLAAQYAAGDLAARGLLDQAIDQFDQQHSALLHGDATFGLMAPRATDLRAVFFSGPDPVNSMVGRYVADARRVAALSPSDPALKPVLARIFAAADGPLLQGLGEVVQAHQQRSDRELAELARIQDATLLVVLLTLLIEALAIFRPLVRQVSRYARQLLVLATRDPLTGALNRRSFMDKGAQAVTQARNAGEPLSVVMIDADHFKRINDTYQHAGGDAVLQALVATLKREVRGGDPVGRLGGEEFAILLPRTGLASAQQMAERVRAAIAAMRVESAGAAIPVTVSIGLAVLAQGDAGMDALLARADQALYSAKHLGRNRVEVMV